MATTFKDSEGREWLVKLTVGAVDRIMAMCLIKLAPRPDADLNGLVPGPVPLDIYDEDHFAELLQNQRVACAALCATIQPQLQSKGITSEQFRDSLDGDAVAGGLDAFWEAVVNFSQPELRATRQAVLNKIREANKLQAKREQTRMESGKIDRLITASLDAEERRIEGKLDRKFAEVSGERLDGSELTRAN